MVKDRGVWWVSNYAHIRIDDMCVKIIEKTDINNPTKRDGFWAYELNSFTPQGLNQRDFFY